MKPRKRAHRSPTDATSLDLFADLLSEEVPPYEAARRMGLEATLGRLMLLKLRQRLGPQAV